MKYIIQNQELELFMIHEIIKEKTQYINWVREEKIIIICINQPKIITNIHKAHTKEKLKDEYLPFQYKNYKIRYINL